MIRFAISGFSDNDRVGNFYPVGTPKREWLTYYALPELSSLKAMTEKTDERLPEIRKLGSATAKTFVSANNYWPGQAASTIRQLQVMLD